MPILYDKTTFVRFEACQAYSCMLGHVVSTLALFEHFASPLFLVQRDREATHTVSGSRVGVAALGGDKGN